MPYENNILLYLRIVKNFFNKKQKKIFFPMATANLSFLGRPESRMIILLVAAFI
tara:strand:- start:52 stop:213 length:162 start_codon:yes stop_codon:yes gene_type:complete